VYYAPIDAHFEKKDQATFEPERVGIAAMFQSYMGCDYMGRQDDHQHCC
jgi:hypothetical protein